MARKASLVSLSKLISDKKAYAAQLRKEVNTLEALRDVVAPAFAVANRVLAAPGVLSWCDQTVVRHYDGSVRVEATGAVYDFETLRDDPRIAAVFEAAESCGLEPKTKDYAGESYAQREFIYDGKVAGVDLSIRFIAGVKSDAPACRSVQVGTEMKEVPKFAIVCE